MICDIFYFCIFFLFTFHMGEVSLNHYRDEAYRNSEEHGFHASDVVLSSTPEGYHALVAQRLALIHSELSEALEADRKDHRADPSLLHSSSLTAAEFESKVKNTFEDELADVLIRVFDLCGWLGIDIQRHLELKMRYNAMREFKHGRNY